MAKLYEELNPTFFGPPELSVPEVQIQDLSVVEKKIFQKKRKHESDLIAKGHARIHQKIKEIRQHVTKAVTLGHEVGVGRLFLNFTKTLL